MVAFSTPAYFQPIFLLIEITVKRLLFNELKIGMQSEITNIKIELVDRIGPLNRFEIAVVLNNIGFL